MRLLSAAPDAALKRSRTVGVIVSHAATHRNSPLRGLPRPADGAPGPSFQKI
jgi:hypothetical protein